MLEQQEPYPAVVVDRRWNLLQANKGAVAMVEFLVGPLTPGAAINLADALVAPDLLRRYNGAISSVPPSRRRCRAPIRAAELKKAHDQFRPILERSEKAT